MSYDISIDAYNNFHPNNKPKIIYSKEYDSNSFFSELFTGTLIPLLENDNTLNADKIVTIRKGIIELEDRKSSDSLDDSVYKEELRDFLKILTATFGEDGTKYKWNRYTVKFSYYVCGELGMINKP
jgi:hypothetical protein